jgi:hypothetical protein
MHDRKWSTGIMAALLTCAVASRAAITSEEQRVLGLLDAERVRTDIQRLSQELIKTSNGVGNDSIVSGSPEEKAMAQHIADRFRQLGLEVRVEEFPVRTATIR